MELEEKLKEEVEFWITFTKDWKKNHDEPVPESALSLRNNALFKLKNYYLEKKLLDNLSKH